MNKIAVYTAIIGDYDKIIDPKIVNANCDYYLFTDTDEPIYTNVWTVVKVSRGSLSATKMARKIKTMPHAYFTGEKLPQYEMTVWQDGRFRQQRSLHDLFTQYADTDIVTLAHYSRDCIYEEADACLKQKRGEPKIIHEQMKKYAEEGYPEGNGLIASGILIRKNNHRVNKLNKLWWTEVERYSERDQLSFNYCLSKCPDVSHKKFSFDVSRQFWIHNKHNQTLQPKR